jgi:hypothetical protein
MVDMRDLRRRLDEAGSMPGDWGGSGSKHVGQEAPAKAPAATLEDVAKQASQLLAGKGFKVVRFDGKDEVRGGNVIDAWELRISRGGIVVVAVPNKKGGFSVMLSPSRDPDNAKATSHDYYIEHSGRGTKVPPDANKVVAAVEKIFSSDPKTRSLELLNQICEIFGPSARRAGEKIYWELFEEPGQESEEARWRKGSSIEIRADDFPRLWIRIFGLSGDFGKYGSDISTSLEVKGANAQGIAQEIRSHILGFVENHKKRCVAAADRAMMAIRGGTA